MISAWIGYKMRKCIPIQTQSVFTLGIKQKDQAYLEDWKG
jgi:hypothetical protein